MALPGALTFVPSLDNIIETANNFHLFHGLRPNTLLVGHGASYVLSHEVARRCHAEGLTAREVVTSVDGMQIVEVKHDNPYYVQPALVGETK